MRILADENIREPILSTLRAAGPDVASVWEDSPSTPDSINLARAVAENRLLITYDDDDEELLFRDRMSGSCGVVRFVFSGSTSGQERAEFIVTALSSSVQWSRMFRQSVFKFSVPPNLERPIPTGDDTNDQHQRQFV